jgi:hypothetical protein
MRDERSLLLGADIAVLVVLGRIMGVVEGAHRVPLPVAADESSIARARIRNHVGA